MRSAREQCQHALFVKGAGTASELADAVSVEMSRAGEILSQLASEALIARDGDASWRLTPQGRAAYDIALAEHVRKADLLPILQQGYREFLTLNPALKQCCTDWQVRMIGSAMVMNDHSDVHWDETVRRRVGRIHTSVRASLRRVAESIPWYATYERRLGRAWSRWQDGDPTALTRPMSSSYHDVWMELHADWLAALRQERSDADET